MITVRYLSRRCNENPALLYVKFYQVHRGEQYRNVSDRITLIPFARFCEAVKLI